MQRDNMARPPSLNTVSRTFITRVQSSADLYGTVEEFALGTWHSIQGWEVLYPGQARRIVALAFMNLVVGWEEFVEACFVRYLAGSSAPSGWKPKLRLSACKSLDHAYALIAGRADFDVTKQYLNWSSWPEVESRALVFFPRGKPFTALSEMQRQRLKDAQIIRNRVAHSSSKCREDFKQVARQFCGLSGSQKLPKGIDVGQVLLDTSGRGFHDARKESLFIHYANLFCDLAELIAPAA